MSLSQDSVKHYLEENLRQLCAQLGPFLTNKKICPNEKMTGMANLIIELVCAWLDLTTKLRLPQCCKSGKPKVFHF